jgi:hypothetical protein
VWFRYLVQWFSIQWLVCSCEEAIDFAMVLN